MLFFLFDPHFFSFVGVGGWIFGSGLYVDRVWGLLSGAFLGLGLFNYVNIEE